jgi:sigma-E factor negative regulatory protein RseA
MSDKSNEKISNLMDGELEVNASRFLLKRMASDSTLSQTWERYHIVRSCLQKSHSEPLSIDIASRVSYQLGLHSNEERPEIKTIPKWLKPVVGIGIAASVAFMSVIMIQNQNNITINPVNAVVQNNVQPSIKVNVPSAHLVGSSRTVPAYLSRYPSLSAKESSIYNERASSLNNAPYIYIINQSQKNSNTQMAPLKIKDIAD